MCWTRKTRWMALTDEELTWLRRSWPESEPEPRRGPAEDEPFDTPPPPPEREPEIVLTGDRR